MQHVQGPAVMKVAEVAENHRRYGGGGSSVKYIITFGEPLISLSGFTAFTCISSEGGGLL